MRGVPPADVIVLTPSPSTEPFWRAAAEHRLVVPRCTACGTYRLPPTPFCWKCRRQGIDWIELSGGGTVYTFVIARQALIPQLADAVPNVVAVIELDDAPGCRLVGNVLNVEPESVEIGMPVVVAWDDVNETVTIPRFVPA